METNERNPLRWSDATASAAMKIVAAYVRKWSGTDSPDTLSPEERDEIRSRIVFDIMEGGNVPEGITPLHHVFRVCRRWRVRGWNGNTAHDHRERRAAGRAARAAERDPGSRESEESRNKSPFRGMSDDARQPTPLAVLIAVETATREGLRYVSDRQRKARRRPVKGYAKMTYKARPTGFAGRFAGRGASGRLLYYPGARTLICWEPVQPERETGRGGKPHVPHVGTVANRQIGKVKTAAIGRDAVGQAMARMAILGRTPRLRFIPAAPPASGVPAMPGDGTEFRPISRN